MATPSLETLRFPIGKFSPPKSSITKVERRTWIDEIAATPAKMRAAVAGLTAEQVETPYRPEGWTVRQLVHHVPDSHLNAYVRFKLALTEDQPAIKAYDQAAWATLSDTEVTPIEVSLQLLAALHSRWVDLLQAM